MAKLRGEVINAPSDGGHETSLKTGGAKHVPNHETGSSLTVSAGDTDDVEAARGMVEFNAGHNGLRKMIGKDDLVVKREFFERFFHRV